MKSSSCSSCCAWFHSHGRSVGLFLLRVTLAIVFIIQGYHKLFGGMDMFTGMVAGIGFPAPTFFAWVAALVEFVGGIALLLGVATRVVSGLLAITMLVAFCWMMGQPGGFGMSMAPFALLGASLALFFTGPGAWSVCRCMNCRCGVACGCCPGSEGKSCACAEHGMMKDGCCQDEKMMKGKK